MTHICFYCDEEIIFPDRYQMIPLERPYINLFVHKNPCYQEILRVGEEKYLNDNNEKLYKIVTNRYYNPINTGNKKRKKKIK